ncbi:MAG TPA: type IV pilus secretin PilQ [Thermoanaerobaculia bacterium]|nr:type IV pilus secretin PilQ [Thermoanaerobaculia bacterium]
MGDVFFNKRDAWQRRIAAATILAFAAWIGCTSSKPAKVVEATPAAAEQSGEDTAKPATAAAEIRTLDLREGAPEVFIDLEASAPLVWTSFRNADGKVIVELPNAQPRSGVAGMEPADGLVSALAVESGTEGSRPLTRLVISTRQEVEHSVSADGNKLEIKLQPVETAQAGRMTFEPLAAEDRDAAAGTEHPQTASMEPMAAAPAAAMPSGGTPDQPATAPDPSGVAATRLDAIEVLASDGGAVVRIAGDGEFPYSTFALETPDRFVIDLDGVVNRSSRSSMTVVGGIVERVRVAQFKPAPKPVSRVVFDLRAPVVPVIERTADALVVTFPANGAQGAAATPPSLSTAPAESYPAEAAPEPAPARSMPAPSMASDSPSDLALAPRAETQMAEARPPAGVEVEDAPPTPPAPIRSRPATPPVVRIQPSAEPTEPREVAPTGGSSSLGLDTFQSQSLGETERVYTGEPIDLKVTNADVTEVLRTFAQISGLNIVVQPGVAGVVTAELDNVPWDQALEQILKINGLSYELEGNVMRIAPVTILRQEAQEKQQLAQAQALSIPLRTVFRRLSYADADEIAGLLHSGQAGLLSQRGSVIVDARTNSLIIKELPQFMDTVISVIDRLDTPEPQVMIEARIIETTKRFTRDIGIQWGFDAIADAAHGNTTGLIFPNNVAGGGAVNVPGGGGNGTINLRLGNVLNTFNLDVALQAAESEGLINILSAPKVATLNNQAASIQSGVQIPIQTIANNTVTVQYVNATLRLDVTPQVTAEGTVMMDIQIQKREPQLAFLVPGATNAPIATKEATTRLLVRDGGTAVIGGIYRVSTDQGEDRVPGLANIPIIGHLFKNKSRREENEELLIFITPRVIKI